MRILYICNEDFAIGGASLSLRAMLDALKGKVDPVLLFREDGPAPEYFRNAGYECEIIPFRRAIFHAQGLIRVLRYLPHAITTAIIQRRCVKECKQRFAGISAVHSNSGSVDIGIRIAAALGVPHIWHIREYLDLGLHTNPFPSWRHWRKELFASDAVIAISPGLYSHLKLEKHPHGVCLPDAVCPAADAIDIPVKDKFIAFMAGTISEIKRPDEAIKIFAASGAKGYVLRLFGSIDPEYKEELKELAEELEVAPRVKFAPFTEDVKSVLSKASAVLVCTDFEGMGRVGVEAMFYGCPVIARNSGGSADLFAEGRGYLYTSIFKAAEYLRLVLEEFPAEMVENARSYAINTFATEDYANKILKVYTDCHIDEN
ncbi:MAG: glycosyltransferase family 4 protein [Bacteroidales bacterium]|nr:glycosyltransferase family 4 protein [Bacteroidales bacterium]